MRLRVVLLYMSLQVLRTFEPSPTMVTVEGGADMVGHDVAGGGVLVLEPGPAQQAAVAPVVAQSVSVQHVCCL